MLIYNDKKYKDFEELTKSENLIGIGFIVKECGANANKIEKIIKKLNIEKQEVQLLPSRKIYHLYRFCDVEKIKNELDIQYRNDVIPEGYISKSDLAKLLNVELYTLNAIENYFQDFKKHKKYFYVNNVRIKFYEFNDELFNFYLEKKNIYITPYRFRRNQKVMITQKLQDVEYIEKHVHHKIRIDYQKMNELFDNKSRYYGKLLEVYKRSANFQIEDSSLMDKHHIIPRFCRDYIYLEDMENTIYITKEIHFLIHLLEYLCCFDKYKNKFFGSMCLLFSRVDVSKINNNVYDNFIDSIIKSINLYQK